MRNQIYVTIYNCTKGINLAETPLVAVPNVGDTLTLDAMVYYVSRVVHKVVAEERYDPKLTNHLKKAGSHDITIYVTEA